MNPFEQACRELLRALGKALNDSFLYKPGHPTSLRSAEEFSRELESLLRIVDEGRLILALDKDNLIANGRVVAKAAEIPPAVSNLFQRLRLHSLVFVSSLSPEESARFLELATLKNDELKDFDVRAWLEKRGLKGVEANSAKYAIVPSQAEGLSGLASGVPAVEVPKEWAAGLHGMNLEAQLAAVVQRSVADPRLQKQVFEAVTRSIQVEIESKVKSATAGLEREKTAAANQAARTESVFEHISAGAVTIDNEGRVLFATPDAEDLVGLPLKDLTGKGIAQTVRGEQYIALAEEISLPLDRPISGEVATTGNQDVAQALKASTAVLKNAEGKVVGILATMPELAKYQELQRMEQEFVASITHELRAPLTSVISALSILEGQLSGKLAKEEDHVLFLASRNARRLSDLVTEILDFQRIQSGHMTIHPAAADVERLIQEAVEGMSAWAKSKGIELIAQCPLGLPLVLADHKRTVQVLTNLVSNALKFTPSGGKIWVRAEKGQGELEGLILFSVKDTGRGIAKEDQARIFEEFVQVASAQQKKVHGTGLGLSISRHLIDRQKGKIWVESELGQGAVFFFTLPMDIAPLTLAPGESAPKPGEKKGLFSRLFGG